MQKNIAKKRNKPNAKIAYLEEYKAKSLSINVSKNISAIIENKKKHKKMSKNS